MRRWVIPAAALLMCLAAFFAVLLRGADLPPTPDHCRMTDLGLLLLEEEAGLYVLGVSDGSAAGIAGILPGDRLTMAAGTALSSAAQLEALLDQPGLNAIPITLTRQEKLLTLALRLR